MIKKIKVEQREKRGVEDRGGVMEKGEQRGKGESRGKRGNRGDTSCGLKTVISLTQNGYTNLVLALLRKSSFLGSNSFFFVIFVLSICPYRIYSQSFPPFPCQFPFIRPLLVFARACIASQRHLPEIYNKTPVFIGSGCGSDQSAWPHFCTNNH